MAEYIIDNKGIKRKLLSKKVNYGFSYYADLFDDVVISLTGYVSENTAKELEKMANIIQSEVGHLKCDENVGFYVVEVGYNLGDCEE